MIPVLHLALIRMAERFGWNTVPPAIEMGGIEEEPRREPERARFSTVD
jgi:hypothetical protein